MAGMAKGDMIEVYHPPIAMPTPSRTIQPSKAILPAAAIATAIAVAAPVIAIIVLAMGDSGDLWTHLVANVLPGALRDTLVLLAGVACVTLFIGVGSAWLVSSFDFPGRTILVWLLPLPLALPTYIAAYIFVEIFEPLGLTDRFLQGLGASPGLMLAMPGVRSLGGAILIMSLVLYPYLYLSARATFQTLSADVFEAARILGARRWQSLHLVAWPMARPAIAVGLSLVLLETLNDIGASEYLGVRTLTVSIFTTWLNRGNLPGAAQLACLMLGIALVLIVMERYGRRHRQIDASAESPRLLGRTRLKGWKAVCVALLCAVPVTLGFILPLLFLVFEIISRHLISQITPELISALGHSVFYSCIATLCALGLGLATVAAHRWHHHPALKACATIGSIGYALPGTVLALGLLTPLVRIDDGLNALAATMGLGHLGLVLAGSGAAIVIAYAIRFMAVAIGFSHAGFMRIPSAYDDSLHVAGASQMHGIRKVYLPLLAPSLWGGAIVVFVDCLKELPATLLLRPLNVETLATSIYQHASRGSFEEGALAALLIILAGIGPVFLLSRLADHHGRTQDDTTPDEPDPLADELR
jgi:iron(III) transport system permease protein